MRRTEAWGACIAVLMLGCNSKLSFGSSSGASGGGFGGSGPPVDTPPVPDAAGPLGCTPSICTPTLLGELFSPGAVALDVGFAYVVSPGVGLVAALALDGTSMRTLAAGQDVPLGVAFDDTDVYWTNYGQAGAGAVLAVPKGGGPSTVLASGLVHPRGIAVDASYVYVAEAGALDGTGGAILRIDKAGEAGAPKLLATSRGEPDRISVDGSNVYWSEPRDATDGRILFVDTGGLGAPRILAAGQPFLGDFAIGHNLYWLTGVQGAQGALVTFDTTSGVVTTLATGLAAPTALAVDADTETVWWAEAGWIRAGSAFGSTVTPPPETFTPVSVTPAEGVVGMAANAGWAVWTQAGGEAGTAGSVEGMRGP